MQTNMKYKSYYYEGPYYQFKDNLGTFKGITMATSPSKAIANLTYRCKCERGFRKDAHISLNSDYLRTT